MAEMKAVGIMELGGTDSIKVMTVPKPVPGEKEVCIELHATSLNPVDFKIAKGVLKNAFPHSFPLVLGWDAAGIVESIGEGVTRVKPGDAVWAYCRKSEVIRDGTLAEYIVVPEYYVAAPPKSLSFEEAATIPLAGLTAWQCLFEVGDLQEGQVALIHAGSGPVGYFGVQFAKWKGATVISTASGAKADYVREAGADLVIDYKTEDFEKVIKEKYPGGIDFVLDSLGGDSRYKSYRTMKRGGFLVSIAGMPKKDEALEKYGVDTGMVFVHADGEQLDTLRELVDNGKLKIPQMEVIPLDDAPAGLKKLEAGKVFGKVVVTIK